MRASRSLRARMIAAGSTGSNAAASRPQIAPALAVDSCCETTVGGKAGKAVGPPPQRRPPGFRDQRGKARIGGDQGVDAAIEIGLGVDAMVSIRDQGLRHQGSSIRHSKDQESGSESAILIPDT